MTETASPKIIGHKYEVISLLGQGGMGEVYKARHLYLDAVRVIKVLRPRYAQDKDIRNRFWQEARILDRRHPNLVALYDFGIDDEGQAFIVMEYIDGRTLHQILREEGPPDLGLGIDVGLQSLSALHHLHQGGFVHRDIAPDNLMLTRSRDGSLRLKIIDLGIAKNVADAGVGMTVDGAFLGKVRYASPEQFGTQGGKLDARSDLYSFGVTFYQWLTGRYPMGGSDHISIMAAHMHQEPLAFEESDPEGVLPIELRRFLLRCLEKAPENRYGDCEEAAAELSSIRRSVRGTDAGHRPLMAEDPADFEGSTAPTHAVSPVERAVAKIEALFTAGRLTEAAIALTRIERDYGSHDVIRALRAQYERLLPDTVPGTQPYGTVTAARPRAWTPSLWIGMFIFVILSVLVSQRIVQELRDPLPGILYGTERIPRLIDAVPQIELGPYYALIIGNNRYERIQRLKTAEEDARALDRLLRERYGFTTELLLNANREQIMDALFELRDKTTRDHNVLVYFAGHGELLKDKSYWQPVEGIPGRTDSAISIEDISYSIDQLDARRVMVMADSCYSGRLVQDSEESEVTLNERLEHWKTTEGKRSRLALSSGGLHPVLDTGDGVNSIFAKAVLKSLEENVDLLESTRLISMVRPQVVDAAALVGSEQRPQLAELLQAGHEGGDFFFLPLQTFRETISTSSSSIP